MRVKCTITIDDAEFVATATDTDKRIGTSSMIADAIAGCLAAIDKADFFEPAVGIVADLCLGCDVPLFADAALAYNNIKDFDTIEFLLVVSRDAIDDTDIEMPRRFIPVPDIAAARAALCG